MSERYFFIAHRGRVVHESESPIDRNKRTVAICGAAFPRRCRDYPYDSQPSCPKCRKVLSDRAAMEPIADALRRDFGE
jgi:hypothetical protein